MISATVAGNLGADAETHDAGETTVTNFSIASNSKVKGEKTTTWVRCAIWGSRGEGLVKYLTKGTKVTVTGSLEAGIFKDKVQLDLRVDQLELMSGGREDADSPKGNGGGRAPKRTPEHRQKAVEPYKEGEDDIPFIENVSCDSGEAWWR